MCGQQQNVRSTKVAPAKKDATGEKEAENEPLEKKREVLLRVYNIQESYEEYDREKSKKSSNKINPRPKKGYPPRATPRTKEEKIQTKRKLKITWKASR